MPRLCSGLMLSLLIASSASAVTIDWTFVGNPGNACETQPQGCFGAGSTAYNIGTHEVTNAQYAEFLNAVAANDTNGVYNEFMGTSPVGGIARSSCSPSCTYSVISGRGDMPVNYVSFLDALRFANWLHNGQPSGPQDGTTTEDGAYTITAQGISDNSIARNPGATVFVPSEDEWYKAAYHNAVGLSETDYFDYPAGSDTQTICSAPIATPNRANCFNAVHDVTPKGSYTGSASPYGTFDQGGNVLEWTEAIINVSNRGLRGGHYAGAATAVAASIRGEGGPTNETDQIGFRVAPEPDTDLLLVAGLLSVLGLAGWRRARA